MLRGLHALIPPRYITMLQRFGKGRNNTRIVFQLGPMVTGEIYILAYFTKDRRKVVWQFLETHLQLSKKVRQIFFVLLLLTLVSSVLETFQKLPTFS
jgi:hypothetical protein